MIFHSTKLPSGLRVVTEPMSGSRAAAIGYWIGAGSRDESPGVQGAAHFLEHLLFKGTELLSARQIAETFDSIGGDANAFSSKEYTCAYARVLDGDVPLALEMLTDMILNPAMRGDEIESERKVILEEISMHEDTPEDLVHDLFAEALFGDHPLAREVMGTVETVGSVSVDALRTFHSQGYRAPKMVLAAAGGVEHDAIVEIAGKLFDHPSSVQPGRPEQRPELGSRVRVVNRPTEQAHIVIGSLAYNSTHPRRFALGVLDALLGGGMASRLFQEIRERRGLAYNVFSYRSSYSETGAFAVYAGTTPTNTLDVLKLINDELDAAGESLSDEEVERAKGHLRGGLVLGLEDSGSRMSRLGKSELIHGEILTVDEILHHINAVTTEEVVSVAAELLGRDHRVIAAIGPLDEDSLRGVL